MFQNEEATTFKMATTEGQHIEISEGEEVFGRSVESGMGCFMDAETQDAQLLENRYCSIEKEQILWEFTEEFFHSHFFDENGAIDQFAFLKPDEEKTREIFLLSKQDMEKVFMQAILVLVQKNQPVKIITEFIEIKSE